MWAERGVKMPLAQNDTLGESGLNFIFLLEDLK